MSHLAPPSEQKNVTQTDAEFYTRITTTLWQTVPPVLLVCGSFGNVMTILVMKRMMAASSSSTACFYLCFIALAVSDLANLGDMFHYWLTRAFHIPAVQDLHSATCKLTFAYAFTCSMTSAWFLVVVTCQRVTSVLWPHRVLVTWTLRRGKVVVGGVVMVSCLVNAPFLFTYDLSPVSNSSQKYSCKAVSDEGVKYFFENVFTWLDLCLSSVFPFLVLLVGNSLLIRSIFNSTKFTNDMTRGTAGDKPRSRASRVSSMTLTLILTSSAFLLLSLPVCVYHVRETSILPLSDVQLNEESQAKTDMLYTVSVMPWYCNCCVNFFLYCISGRKFRAEMKRLLCERQDSAKRPTKPLDLDTVTRR